MNTTEEEQISDLAVKGEVPTNHAWLQRYATPPEETSAERTARLNRKRQAEFRHRRRTAVSQRPTVPNENNAPAVSFPPAWTARYATPPNEDPAAKMNRLKRKHQSELYYRRKAKWSNIQNSISSVTGGQVAVQLPVCNDAVQHPLRQQWEAIRRKRVHGRYGTRKINLALGHHESYNWPKQHCLGARDPCPYCAAQKWQSETETLCCNGGQVRLPSFSSPASSSLAQQPLSVKACLYPLMK